MIERIALPFLAPILFVQGRRVRATVPRLPEAAGPREGRSGTGPRLSLLVAGDSAAAGVGVETQDAALLGQLVGLLSTDHQVRWRLEARTGETTRKTIARLKALTGERAGIRFDVVVTSLGVNDLTRGRSLGEWRTDQTELRRVARERLGARLLIVAGLPPVEGFPALPQPLRWYLGRKARTFSRALESDVAAEPDARFQSLRFSLDPVLMASDGFHPGPEIYRGWAERVSARVRQTSLATSSPTR